MNCIPYIMWVLMQVTSTPFPTSTPTSLPICEFTPTPSGEYGYQDDFLKPIFFNTPTPGNTATLDPLTPTVTPLITSTIQPTAYNTPVLQTGYYYVDLPGTFTFNHTYNYYQQFSIDVTSVASSENEAFLMDITFTGNCNLKSMNNSGPSLTGDTSTVLTTSGKRYIKRYNKNATGADSLGHVHWVTGAGSNESAWTTSGSAQFEYYANCSGSVTFSNLKMYRYGTYRPTQNYIPPATATPIPSLTPTPCRTLSPLDVDDQISELDNTLVGTTCYQLLPNFEFSLEGMLADLPDWMELILSGLITTVLNTVGIETLPSITIDPVEVCLERYTIAVTLLQINLVPYIASLISLLSIGLIIQEFRS